MALTNWPREVLTAENLSIYFIFSAAVRNFVGAMFRACAF